MANEKEIAKILGADLSLAEKTWLAHTVTTPGWQVVIKLANEAGFRAVQDISKLDPEGPDYERKVVERGRRARNINEAFDLLFRSLYAHKDSVIQQENKEKEVAEDAVANRFGIHSAKKGEPIDAITKTFGIHPAKPPKAVKK